MKCMYISIEKPNLEKHAEKAHEEAMSSYGIAVGDEDDQGTLLFEELKDSDMTTEFSNGKITMCGCGSKGKDDIAFVSLEAPLSIETVAEICEYYVKRLNRLRTVIEATTSTP